MEKDPPLRIAVVEKERNGISVGGKGGEGGTFVHTGKELVSAEAEGSEKITLSRQSASPTNLLSATVTVTSSVTVVCASMVPPLREKPTTVFEGPACVETGGSKGLVAELSCTGSSLAAASTSNW
eukprot:scaffold665_cov341-Prasinococcus_capsulatus_cf.AAC.16